ncbi:unnamed protein product [Cylicocyclus nassatus]|uniref:Uncharacterized protein n=1 Tax=Cylicocyclus nassatus TaxID=53992 RepID=A0AA36HB45_CYLNA|nr:unnamed protein product [Cylicocyclus nassatus]
MNLECSGDDAYNVWAFLKFKQIKKSDLGKNSQELDPTEETDHEEDVDTDDAFVETVVEQPEEDEETGEEGEAEEIPAEVAEAEENEEEAPDTEEESLADEEEPEEAPVEEGIVEGEPEEVLEVFVAGNFEQRIKQVAIPDSINFGLNHDYHCKELDAELTQ